MQLFITILHVMLSLALILIILLQPGKEGAAVFGGGGGNQMYGPRGQANFLGRATTIVAAMFMVTSITLAYRSSTRTKAGTGNLEDAILDLEVESAPTLSTPTNTAPSAPAEPAGEAAPSTPEVPAAVPGAPAEGAAPQPEPAPAE